MVSTPADPVRQRIVAAARRHFFADGFRRITMDELAGELGMSKKTLYAHFASKGELLEAVILNKFAESQALFESATADKDADFQTHLHALLACVHRVTEEIRPPFIRDMQREAPELFELVQTRRRALIHRHFTRLFNQGRKAGMIRRDIPISLMIEILLGAAQSIVNPDKMIELGLEPRTAVSAILRLLLEGALVRTGRPVS